MKINLNKYIFLLIMFFVFSELYCSNNSSTVSNSETSLSTNYVNENNQYPNPYQYNTQVQNNFASAPVYEGNEFYKNNLQNKNGEIGDFDEFTENQEKNKTLNQKNIKNYNTNYNKIIIKKNGKTVIKVINNGEQNDDGNNDADLVNTGIIIGDISGFNKIKSTGIIDGKITKNETQTNLTGENKKNNFVNVIKNIGPIQLLFLLGLLGIGTMLFSKLSKKNKGVLNNISNSTINISGNLIVW